jgi:hypothetical protein
MVNLVALSDLLNDFNRRNKYGVNVDEGDRKRVQTSAEEASVELVRSFLRCECSQVLPKSATSMVVESEQFQ